MKYYKISEENITRLYGWIGDNLLTKHGVPLQQFLAEVLKEIPEETEKESE